MTTYDNALEIAATPAQVFAAIGTPERLARWWGPEGFANTFNVCDFTPGGKWSLVMHGPDGSNWPNENAFAEIEEPYKVVVVHDSVPAYRLTIGLVPTAAGTMVSWSQTFADAELGRRLEPIVVPANRQNLERLAEEVRRGLAC